MQATTPPFVHHAATPGLILLREQGKIVGAVAFGKFTAHVYVKDVGEIGYQTIPVEGTDAYVAFNNLLTNPEPIGDASV